MNKLVIVSGLLSLYLCGSAVYAQSVINRNRDIARMVGNISADSLHSYVNTLAGFGSRHTHSSFRPEDGRIGAAQQWLQKKFKSLNSGLQVSVDSYMLPPTKRVPSVREYRNVVAVLPGSDPSDNRLFIMSGHLDSRAADGNDPDVYSPGANDDGSAIAAMNLAVITSLACAPSAPERVSVNLSNPDNHTQLKWDEPAYGKAAGYYVVMRETTAAQWQKKFYTADRSMVLPYSRDNYIFGVQAVGENGCESIATVATAGNR